MSYEQVMKMLTDRAAAKFVRRPRRDRLQAVAYGDYGSGMEFASFDLDNEDGRPAGMCYGYVPSEDDLGVDDWVVF